MTTYLQLWNMSNVDITSGQLRFVDLTKQGMSVVKNNGNSDGHTLTSFDALDHGQRTALAGDFGFQPADA